VSAKRKKKKKGKRNECASEFPELEQGGDLAIQLSSIEEGKRKKKKD